MTPNPSSATPRQDVTTPVRPRPAGQPCSVHKAHHKGAVELSGFVYQDGVHLYPILYLAKVVRVETDASGTHEICPLADV